MRRTEGKFSRRGFTLIEMSIVLVIIGLIVGGIVTGQSLIAASYVRAEVTQIQQCQTATATFREKFGYLPGDIPPTAVTQFGFTASPLRSGVAGDGDGNGELDGTNCCAPYSFDQGGETVYFWEDLSTNSHLIEGGFNTAAGPNYYVACVSIAACSPFFPYAKIGNGAFVYVYSGYAAECCTPPYTGFGPNFFGLAFINSSHYGNVDQGATPPAPALTVTQAYAIDSKIDDGLPTTGNVLAQYLGATPHGGAPDWSVSSSTPNATTCYDTSSGSAAYSTSYQNGNNVNCGISFKFQAGD